jgi:hypothetical protein
MLLERNTMIEKFKKYLVKAQSPAYPPYHTGPYLEEYFLYYYFKNIEKFKNVKHQYIPVLWTELYLHVASLVDDLQNDLNELDKDKFYFTVSQHDDAPFQQLPPNTINFSAGGNQPNTTPIPLICSPITDVKEVEKDIFCSFVGSITAPLEGWGLVSHNLRMKMLETLVDKKEYVLKPKSWTNEVKKDRQDMFLDLTARSKFTLCPRGYGATSFRLYEAMQLKSVPVYIYYEKPHLPFVDRINWNDICVLINIDDIGKLDDTLKNISNEKYANMVKTMQETYQKYFTLEGMCNGILETLENIK